MYVAYVVQTHVQTARMFLSQNIYSINLNRIWCVDTKARTSHIRVKMCIQTARRTAWFYVSCNLRG